MENNTKNPPEQQSFSPIGFEILEQLPGSFWAVDKQYYYLAGNQQFKSDLEATYGITPELGFNLLSHLSKDQAREWKAFYDRAFSGEHFQLEKEGRSGVREGWIEYNFSPIKNTQGKILAVVILSQDITNRKATESTLETLLGNLPGIAFRCLNNQKWDMLFLSDGVSEMTGYSPDELLVGGEVTFDDLIHPDDRRQVWEIVQGAAWAERPYTIRYRIITKGGELRWVSENGKATRFSNEGEPLELEGFISDITPMVQATRELEISHQTLSNILDSVDAHIYVSDLDTYEVIYLNQKMAQDFGQDLEGEKCYQVFRGFKEPCTDCPIHKLQAPKRGPSEQVVWESINEITGRWYLNTDRIIPWIDEELVHIQIAVDINDRKVSEQALAESEARYRNLLEFSPDGIITAELSGKVLSVNKAFLELSGYQESDFIGKDYSEIPTLFKRDLGFFLKIVEHVVNGNKHAAVDFKWKHATGETREGEAKFSLAKYGNTSILQVIVRDITEQKIIQQALSDSEARYRALVESSPDGILTIKPSGKVLSVNKSFLELTGFPEDAFINVHFSKIPTLLKSDWTFYKNAFKSVLAGGIKSPIEFRWKNIDGEIKDGEARISPVKIGGKTILQSIVRDITDFKKHQIKLRESEERYRTLFNAMTNIGVIYDQDGRMLLINDEASRFSGIDPEKSQGEKLEKYLPETHKDVVLKLQEVLDSNKTIVFEHPLKDPTGDQYWYTTSMQPFHLDTQSDGSVLSISTDITPQKEAQKALEFEQRRTQQYLDVADIMLVALNIKRKVISINPKGCEVLGLPEEEIIGKNWFENFLVTDEIDQVNSIFDKVIVGNTDIAEYYENRIRRPDGTSRLIAWRNSLLKDENGNHIGVFSSGEDITDRKAAENALVASKETAERYLNIAAKIILSLDREGNITLLNPGGHQLLEYQPGELVGKNWYKTCLVKDQARDIQSSLEGLMSGKELETQSIDSAVITRSGQIKYISWHNSLLKDNDGEIIGILSSGEDITEKKEILDDLSRSRELIIRLSQAAQQVQNILEEETIFQAIGEEIVQLGFNISILMLSDSGDELRQKFMSYDSRLINKSMRLTGILPSHFAMKIEPDSYFARILENQKSFIDTIDQSLLRSALPGISERILGQVIKHFGLQKAIYAPLIDGGDTIGIMAVIGKNLSEEDVPPMAVFANQVSTALRNARYAKDLRQRSEDLEKLTALISETEESERKRLSQELHDQVGQSLALLGFNLNQIKDQVSVLPNIKLTKIDQAQQILNDVSNGIRSVMDDLRPAILDDYGLVSALHWYTDKFKERTGLATEVKGASLDPRLTKDKEIALFRITQEALTNITRHAKASKIIISVLADDAEVTVLIEDDGVGFDLNEVQKEQKGQGWGLINIQERITRIGGDLDILTEPGEGTQLVLTTPRE